MLIYNVFEQLESGHLELIGTATEELTAERIADEMALEEVGNTFIVVPARVLT